MVRSISSSLRQLGRSVFTTVVALPVTPVPTTLDLQVDPAILNWDPSKICTCTYVCVYVHILKCVYTYSRCTYMYTAHIYVCICNFTYNMCTRPSEGKQPVGVCSKHSASSARLQHFWPGTQAMRPPVDGASIIAIIFPMVLNTRLVSHTSKYTSK